MSDEDDCEGYDVEFLNEINEDLQCSICLHVMKDPHQIVPCGHRFCHVCITKLLRTCKENATCPYDREPFSSNTIFPDNNCKRTIMALQVECKHSSMGCQWKSTLSQYKNHLSDACLYEDDCCSNEGCNEQFLRKYKVDHETIHCRWRILKCDLCSEAVRLFEYHEHKEDNCPVVSCPNHGCKMILDRQKIRQHMDNECVCSLRRCSLCSVGCTQEGTNEEIDEHMRSSASFHINLLCAELKSVNEKLHQCMKANQCFVEKQLENPIESDQLANTQNGSLLLIWSFPVWHIQEYQELRSPVYSTGPRGYCFILVFLKRKTDAVVSIRIIPGSYDHLLPWPFKCKFSLHLVDQSQTNDRRHINRRFDFDIIERIPHCFERPKEYSDNCALYPILVILDETLNEERYSRENMMTLAIRVTSFSAEDVLCLPEL